MSIELRQLEWALVVAQHRSLRQAAEELNVRQSTLSRSLRVLEYKLGATLFERTNGGTRPTIAGQEFLDAARRIVDETQGIASRFRTRARGESGRLTIGVHASLSAGNLRATLLDHRSRFPDVDTRLVDGSGDHLLSDLANSAIDVAFLIEGNLRWADKSLPVWSERVVVAVPETHPLATHDALNWEDLRTESLLLPMRGPGPEFLKLFMSKMGTNDPTQLCSHDISLDRFLTLVGAGWGLLLALEGATGATYPGVSFRELRDADGPTRLNFRVCWRDTNCNPSLPPFLDLLRARYPEISRFTPKE
ncbi:DNA-binding transcriptional LysR family regulator [Bradyrhizobium japonicum]|uniref:LysR substrate-binding domain-containing protein n=1 Tax=Bradyrhizobium TaxID=374 RepID=UPI000576261A|nr:MULTISPECIES: LysR family transcriptional regulator [Bradyrhizobium]MBR0948360.1 LysR family transcriptional regulator [Bradyrhizobium liaoningense]MDI2077337.1 LysR family transcriptional regulator [Bradyrhizobium sp. Mp27]